MRMIFENIPEAKESTFMFDNVSLRVARDSQHKL